jgi:hypothetical protein
MIQPGHSRRILVGLLAATCAACGVSPAQEQGTISAEKTALVASSAIAAPGETVLGRSQAEWSSRWWQWALAQPWDSPRHPVRYPDPGDCSLGQSGDVWFLGGFFFTVQNVDTENHQKQPPGVHSPQIRDCTVPAGKWLELAIIVSEASTMPDDNCGDLTPTGLQACATGWGDTNTFARVEIDDAPVDLGAVDTSPYRLAYAPFDFTLTPQADNLPLGAWQNPGAVSGATYQAASDGVHLMVRPLVAGSQHVVRFHAGAVGFAYQVEYRLNVVP